MRLPFCAVVGNLVLAAAIGLAAAPASAGDRGLARRYFDEGVAQLKRGDLDPALSSLSKSIAERSSFAPAYAWRAEARYALGGGRGLADDLRRAARARPDDPEGRLARGTAYVLLGEPEKALEDFDEALRLNPDDPDAYFGRGRAYRAAGDSARAIREWSEALRLDPELVLARYDRGLAYYEQGAVDQAVDDLARALRTNPKFPLPYALLGVIFAQRGDPSRAVQAYSKALFLNPNFTYALLGRAAANLKLGRKDAAMRDYEEAIRVGGDSYAPFFDRGEARYRLGDKDGGLADFRRALDTAVDHTPSAIAMANRLAVDGLYPEALAMYGKALSAAEAAPRWTRSAWIETALLRRSGALETHGDNDKALRDLDDLVKRSSGSVAGWTARGRLLFKLGKDEAALASLDRAVFLDSRYVPARIARGRLYAANHRNREALEDFNAAIRHAPQAADAYTGRGLLYLYAFGDDEKAMADVLKAVALAPQDPDAHFNLGVARHRRGQFRQAIESFDKALSLKGPAAQVLERRAESYFGLGDVSRAIADLRAALEVEPQNARLYTDLAFVRLRSHDYVQAERDLGQAAQLGADDFPYHFVNGQLHGRERRYRLAVAELEKAARLDPRSAETQALLCRAYRLLPDARAAVRACDRAIQMDSRLGEAYVDRGLARLALRELGAAVLDLDAGHKLGAKHAPAQLARSYAHAAQRQYRESDEAYRLAIDLDPLAREADLDFDGAPIAKPDYYTLMGSLEKGFEKDQGNPYVFLMRANALHNGGYFDRAIMEYTKAMEMDGTIAAAYLGRGAALGSQQSYEAAEQDYRRALELSPRDPEAHARLLTLLAVRRRFDAGLRAAAEAARVTARQPEIYLRAGNLRYFLKDVARAQENYALALQADPSYADAHNGLGLCEFARQKYPDAIEHFSRAIAFLPNDRFYRNRAAAWMNLAQFANAAADYRNALAVNTDPDMTAEYQKLLQSAQAQIGPAADYHSASAKKGI